MSLCVFKDRTELFCHIIWWTIQPSSGISSVYVDDILLKRSNFDENSHVKNYLQGFFFLKDMGKAKYLLNIDLAYQPNMLVLSQYKYVLHLL